MYNILSRASQAHTFTQLFVVYIYIAVTSTTLTHLEEPQSYPIIHLSPSFSTVAGQNVFFFWGGGVQLGRAKQNTSSYI